MIRFPAARAPDSIRGMTDVKKADQQANKDVKTRNRTVKPGHLEVAEFTSGTIGAASPFGRSNFPLPTEAIHYEHPEPVPTRILEDERH